ncbi:MAG: hypothetical protein MUC96_19295 [Myxococcaceae bacterium]|jgi:hypothetical protein|nr:hypothetical protein [Myxococcaceae bacterium]
MSIRSLGMPALRAVALPRQGTTTLDAAPLRRALGDGFDGARLPSTRRQAVIGGGNGPINVGPVFGDSGLPAPGGIIGPTGPTVNEPGVVGPVQDNTLAPKVPGALPPAPGEPVNQNTQPPDLDARGPVNDVPPPVQNTTPPVDEARPPGQPGAPTGGPNAPGTVGGVSGPSGPEAQSLDDLVTALVQVIDELVKQLTPGTASPQGAQAEPRPPTTSDDRAATAADAGLVSFSIRASAHFVISG